MKLNKTLVAATASLAMSLSSQAMANDALDRVSKAWAQCGIGGMIFKDQPIPASILNILTFLGTTAVVSLEVSPETCKGVNVAAAVFINESINTIESDAAQGQGAHLTAMLTLMGVPAAEQSNVALTIRSTIAADENFVALDTTSKAQAMYAIAEQAKS